MRFFCYDLFGNRRYTGENLGLGAAPGNSAAGFLVDKIQLGLFSLGNGFGFLLFAAWVTVSWVGDCSGVFVFISFLPSKRAL